MKLNCSNLEELPRLLERIHDRYFRIESISYDDQVQRWSLDFGDKRRGPYTETLCVLGVRAYEIEDTERIGTYDINTVQIDLESHTVRIVCNVPLKLDLIVSSDFEIIV